MTSYSAQLYSRFDDDLLERFTATIAAYVPEFDAGTTPIGAALAAELFAPEPAFVALPPHTEVLEPEMLEPDLPAASAWVEPRPSSVVLELPRAADHVVGEVWYGSTTEPDEDADEAVAARLAG